MSWLILIIISNFFYAFYALFSRVLFKDEKNDPAIISPVFQIIICVIFLIVGLLFTDFDISGFKSDQWLSFLVLMIFNSLGNYFAFNAYARTSASNVVIITSSKAIFTMISAYFLLGETVSWIQLFGTILVIYSIILISYKTIKVSFKSGEIFALLSAFMFGVENSNDKILLKDISLYPFLVVTFFLPSIFLFSLSYKKLNKVKELITNKNKITKVLILSVLFAFTAITFFAALQKSEIASKVTTVGLTSSILVVALSMIFLGEKDNLLNKVISIILSIFGVYFIS